MINFCPFLTVKEWTIWHSDSVTCKLERSDMQLLKLEMCVESNCPVLILPSFDNNTVGDVLDSSKPMFLFKSNYIFVHTMLAFKLNHIFNRMKRCGTGRSNK